MEEKELGIGFQYVFPLKTGRQLILTGGFPADWNVEQINQLVDKLTAVADRQQLKADIQDYEASLKIDYAQLMTNEQQQAGHKNRLELAWYERGKQGEFHMNDQQSAEYNNYEKNIKMLRSAILEKERKLQELVERCR